MVCPGVVMLAHNSNSQENEEGNSQVQNLKTTLGNRKSVSLSPSAEKATWIFST